MQKKNVLTLLRNCQGVVKASSKWLYKHWESFIYKKILKKLVLGQYVVLFFYPLDFTFVCPTEIIAFSDRVEEFKKIKTAVIGWVGENSNIVSRFHFFLNCFADVQLTAISPTWPGSTRRVNKAVWAKWTFLFWLTRICPLLDLTVFWMKSLVLPSVVCSSSTLKVSFNNFWFTVVNWWHFQEFCVKLPSTICRSVGQ